MSKTLGNTDFLNMPLFKKGKVRDVYELRDKLLVVVTDRISAFDVVFPTLVPNKGKVLNKISEFWFNYTRDIIGNHMITTDVAECPEPIPAYKEELEGRSMLVYKVNMLPVECVVRGYLAGSALKEYRKSGSICGIKLPDGLAESQKLPEPIFTPAAKAETGHDENISMSELENRIGKELAGKLADTSIALYNSASRHAESRGLILADTKFEFGFLGEKLVVADEMFTPDSSRFWDMAKYEVGKPQDSFDKQYVRDYLESINWDKNPPAPLLPDEVVRNTELKYLEAYAKITGREL